MGLRHQVHIYLEYHTDKKTTKFSSYIRKFRVAFMRKGFQIYEEMGKYLTKYEEAVSHI